MGCSSFLLRGDATLAQPFVAYVSGQRVYRISFAWHLSPRGCLYMIPHHKAPVTLQLWLDHVADGLWVQNGLRIGQLRFANMRFSTVDDLAGV
jgi:hypothetical protein